MTRGPSKTCNSFVGKVHPGQTINLGDDGCYFESVIIHEFIHAIGFDHEFNRFDRDDFVKIKWENIQDGFNDTFEIHDKWETFNTTYDWKSIMHYTSSHLSINENDPQFATMISNVR